MPTKAERLDEFFRRLASERAASSFEEAYGLLCETLNALEEELSGVEDYNPDSWRTQDRMYPPQRDNARPVRDYPGVTRFRSVGHNTFIGSNGAIEIQQANTVVFQKPGADGKDVRG